MSTAVAVPESIKKGAALCREALAINLRRFRDDKGRDWVLPAAGGLRYDFIRTRDLCFAAEGLQRAGHAAAVRDGLELALNHRLDDGVLPMLFDSGRPGLRRALAPLGLRRPLIWPLTPRYAAKGGAVSIDGNALVVIAAAGYVQATGDLAFARERWRDLEAALAFYGPRMRKGLLRQAARSDWQDVRGRRDAVFYTNLLRWRALLAAADLAEAAEQPARAVETFRKGAEKTAGVMRHSFWNDTSGFFTNRSEGHRLSSDGNLLAIAWGFATPVESRRILEAFETTQAWLAWGPRCVTPDYPTKDKSAQDRWTGRRWVYDRALWPWLAAAGVRALLALGMRDEAVARATAVCDMMLARREVGEVYDAETGQPAGNRLARSESPFTWSAGMLLAALEQLTI